MLSTPQLLRQRWLGRGFALSFGLGLALLLVGTPAWSQTKEASRIHVLVVADTDANGAMVFGLGLDGDNVKRVFDQQLSRVGKSNRYTLELFTGNKVTPQNILNYYQNLKTNPTETLVFYYTGHGITDKNQGHLITTHKGFLSRKMLLEAMQKHNPQLTVLLTDCCANYGPGGPPVGGVFKAGGFTDTKMAGMQMLLGQVSGTPTVEDRTRPKTNINAEPVQPPVATSKPDLMGNLFFQHKGLVDINAAEMGKSASGKFNMGGSFFTIALCDELKKTIKEVDRNDDGFAEWREFYPGLDKATIQVSQKAFFFQKPQAFNLGEVVK